MLSLIAEGLPNAEIDLRPAAAAAFYCREMFRADVSPDGITQVSVYCTGDWDAAQVARHAREVSLIRP